MEENKISKPAGSFTTEDKIVEVLRTVYDPEIPVNIYDLGLIYKIDFNEQTGSLDIDMTLTAPGCPMADYIVEDVRQKLLGIRTVMEANVNIVFEPQWDESMMSEQAKADLGLL
jgi:FeS assembly SUF system protein